MRTAIFCRPSGPAILNLAIQGLRTRFARPCPWLPYSAPPALARPRLPLSAPPALGPGYLIPRLRRTAALATLFRASGARAPQATLFRASGARPRLPYSAPPALARPRLPYSAPPALGPRAQIPRHRRAAPRASLVRAAGARAPLATLFRASGARRPGYLPDSFHPLNRTSESPFRILLNSTKVPRRLFSNTEIRRNKFTGIRRPEFRRITR
jgi:hypothetical protein